MKKNLLLQKDHITQVMVEAIKEPVSTDPPKKKIIITMVIMKIYIIILHLFDTAQEKQGPFHIAQATLHLSQTNKITKIIMINQ